jgi:hypothetical protein
VLLSTLPLLALSLVLAGCGSKDSGAPTTTTTEKEKDKGGKAPPKGLKAVEAKGTTTIKGKITLKEDRPNLQALTAALHEQMQKNQDKDFCLKEGSEPERSQQEFRIGDNGGVGNVFVWIEPEAGHYFPISDAQLTEAKKPVTLDQPHCAFTPHCFVLFTEYPDPKNPRKSLKTGQELIVKNSAPKSHNTKWEGDADEPKGNLTIEAGKNLVIKDLVPSKNPITFQCTIHTWMRGYARDFNHPYATVSKVSDDPKDPAYGTYEIKGAPANIKVRIFAWHESQTGPTKSVELDLKEGETINDFVLELK